MTTTDLDLTGSYADSVASGLGVTQDTLLDGIVAAGTAYINQVLITIAQDTKAFTASKDTYVDVGDDTIVTYTEVVNGAGAPALAADAIRLAKVVTDGTTITGITDLSTPTVYQYVFTTVSISGGSTMELFNNGGSTLRIKFGAASTSGGMPLTPSTSRHVTEDVYVKPVGPSAHLMVTR